MRKIVLLCIALLSLIDAGDCPVNPHLPTYNYENLWKSDTYNNTIRVVALKPPIVPELGVYGPLENNHFTYARFFIDLGTFDWKGHPKYRIYYYACLAQPICDLNQTTDFSTIPATCMDKCDENQTLDTSFDPPKCVSKCQEKDKDFPKIANNEEVVRGVTEQTCSDVNGSWQTEKKNCITTQRCVKETEEPPKVCKEQVNSYVSPRDGTFHEDIALTGVEFSLHYDSSEWNSTSIAHGWSLSSHARLKENKIYLGSGSVYAYKQSTQENNLTVVIYGSSEYLFDANGRLQSTRDLYTKETETTFSYDSNGDLATITNIYAEVTTINRDSNAIVTSITAPHGQTTYLAIDAQGDLVEVQYEDTSSYVFEYERHLMTAETEPNGNRFLHFFDDQGKVVKVIDAEQGEWNFGSASSDTYGSHTVTRASGDIITYKNHFLENNTTLRTEKVLPTGDIVEYSHSIDDSTSSTLSCGMQSTNIYKTNTDGSLFKDPYSNRRVLESSTVVTPSGLSNTSTPSREYLYQTDGTLKRITNTNITNTKTSQYIKNFKRYRNISITPEGKKSTVQYDTKMQNPLVINPYGLKKTTYEYDTQGRVTKETRGTRVRTYSYDSKGNLQSITDPLGKSTSYSYDSRDRVVQTNYADGTEEHFIYDENSNLITRTIPTPANHIFTYNGVNKRVGTSSPLQKQTTYTYDKQRRVTKVTKPSTKTIDTVYTNGRVSSVTTAEGTTNYTYSCQSNVSSISKGSESFSFIYDGTLLTSMNQAGVLNQSIDYTYNNDFLPTSMTYAMQTENYSYNQDNQPTQIGNFSIVRTNKDRNITITDGSYSKITKINRYGELRKQEDTSISIKLFRNLAGQIVKKVETLKDSKKVIYHYTYDKRGRLTEVKNRKNIVETYSYDSNGNRATATVNNQTITASYTLDDNLVVYGDNTYRYDEDGYLEEKVTPDGSTTYSYGALGELLSVVTPTQTITYKHNANNQRVSKEVNGTVVEKYLWADLTTLLAVYDKDDNLVQRFEYADTRMPVAMTMGATKYYLHYDQVGSLRAVSDSSHNTVKEISYDTYGNVLSDSNEAFKVPFGFAGGLYDTDTKLTRFGYRDYDAYTGKWTAKDPIGFGGGDSNLYGYVLGDPVDFVDPTGEFGILGGIIGGVLELGTQFFLNGGRWECVDWYDVGAMAAVGAVAPSGLASGLKIFKSNKASKNLSQQLNRSRTTNRKNKLKNRINKHQNSIGNEIMTQGAISGGKYGTKEFLNMPQNGECNNECQ